VTWRVPPTEQKYARCAPLCLSEQPWHIGAKTGWRRNNNVGLAQLDRAASKKPLSIALLKSFNLLTAIRRSSSVKAMFARAGDIPNEKAPAHGMPIAIQILRRSERIRLAMALPPFGAARSRPVTTPKHLAPKGSNCCRTVGYLGNTHPNSRFRSEASTRRSSFSGSQMSSLIRKAR